MTTDNKTLATVKHGGCVRLGDGLQLANEWRHVFAGDGHDMAGANKNTIRRFIQAIDALSAQPSPGGQDASFEQAWLSATDYYAVSRDAAHFIWKAALAARQPVGEPVAWKYQDKAADGVWEDRISEKLPCWEHRNSIPLYAAPPAQAVDLGRDDSEVLLHIKTAPEPVSQPSEEWVEQYAQWHDEGRRVMRRADRG